MNKAVLITGAATRIGRVLAKNLVDDGWTVVIHYNTSRAQAVELSKEIGAAPIVQADLAKDEDMKSLIERSMEATNSALTALINNASTYQPDIASDFTSQGYEKHMDVNLKAPLVLSRHFARQLPDGENGCIINMIDQRILRPTPEFFTYGLSKSALYAATKTMAQTFAPNIRVNAIGPGPTLKSIHQTDTEFENESAQTLLGTGSPPETILQAVRYLLAAKAVTGQMIAVDGGQHLGY